MINTINCLKQIGQMYDYMYLSRGHGLNIEYLLYHDACIVQVMLYTYLLAMRTIASLSSPKTKAEKNSCCKGDKKLAIVLKACK